MRNVREHPRPEDLEEMANPELSKYAIREAQFLLDQKQTAVARLLLELADRLHF